MRVQPLAHIEAIAFDLYGTLLDVTDIQGVPAEVVATLRQKQLGPDPRVGRRLARAGGRRPR